MSRRSNRLAGISSLQDGPAKSTRSNAVPRILKTKNAEMEKLTKELKKWKSQLAAEKKKVIKMTNDHRQQIFLLNMTRGQLEREIDFNRAEHHAEINQLLSEREHEKVKLKHLELQMKALDDDDNQDEVLQRERRTIASLRIRNKDLTRRLSKKEEQKIGEPMAWKVCEICLHEYSQNGDKTPRLLSCGHTLCLGCINQIAKPDYLLCPFDRTLTSLADRTTEQLPKNFLVFNM